MPYFFRRTKLTNNKTELNTVILIPALNPDEKMCKLISDLKSAGFRNIVCIDDGSAPEYKHYFQEARDSYGCDLLTHIVNMGKGRAMKTGLNYICQHFPDAPGVITADSDGQHLIEDILKCACAMLESSDSLIFGCRDFKKGSVPFKSYYGNTLTRTVMKIFCGIQLSDTQTGLRAIPMALVPSFVTLKGERYEYELQQILFCKESNIPIREVPIRTVYIEENKGSHFNPFKDSIRIYAQFGKFFFASISSFLLDIILFSLFVKLFQGVPRTNSQYITWSTVCARILSAVWNFTINRRIVFHSKTPLAGSAGRYTLLALCQMGLSALLVTLLHNLTGGNETLLKIPVDCLLFLLSFVIQREFVFDTTNKKRFN